MSLSLFHKTAIKVSENGLKFLGEIVEVARTDYKTFEILEEYYKDEEEDMYSAQQQLELIALIGEQNKKIILQVQRIFY